MRRLEIDDDRWCRFVAGSPDAGPFHHPVWAHLVARAYGYDAFALVLERNGAIVAGLPVVQAGHRWISLPFTDHCSPLGDRTDLVGQLDAARREAGIARFEVREALAGSLPHRRAWGVVHRLALDPDPSRVFAGFHRSQVQRNIARAERGHLDVRWATARGDLVDAFYALHLGTRRRQGAPVQPRRYFRLLWDDVIAGGLGFAVLVFAAGRPVAGAVFLVWKGTVVYKYGASDPAYWRLRPNHLLFWTVIRWACQHGCRTFDFGRTEPDNAGLRAFKSGWGAQEHPLTYSSVGAAAADGLALGARLVRPVIQHSPAWVCRLAGELLYRYAA
jgi:CelD/BcsL family acetyltransferase involved in cellulose biosynthesis